MNIEHHHDQAINSFAQSFLTLHTHPLFTATTATATNNSFQPSGNDINQSLLNTRHRNQRSCTNRRQNHVDRRKRKSLLLRHHRRHAQSLPRRSHSQPPAHRIFDIQCIQQIPSNGGTENAREHHHTRRNGHISLQNLSDHDGQCRGDIPRKQRQSNDFTRCDVHQSHEPSGAEQSSDAGAEHGRNDDGKILLHDLFATVHGDGKASDGRSEEEEEDIPRSGFGGTERPGLVGFEHVSEGGLGEFRVEVGQEEGSRGAGDEGMDHFGERGGKAGSEDVGEDGAEEHEDGSEGCGVGAVPTRGEDGDGSGEDGALEEEMECLFREWFGWSGGRRSRGSRGLGCVVATPRGFLPIGRCWHHCRFRLYQPLTRPQGQDQIPRTRHGEPESKHDHQQHLRHVRRRSDLGSQRQHGQTGDEHDGQPLSQQVGTRLEDLKGRVAHSREEELGDDEGGEHEDGAAEHGGEGDGSRAEEFVEEDLEDGEEGGAGEFVHFGNVRVG
mmetsp:Transcript_25987/g.54405  ORF Transcript_25987/g.54405 Transcript_25987/m.54405 type:complete len:497 (-) Transcript_25987:284-1774(-)